MKRCMVCGAESEDRVLCCPKCGEASWSSTVIVAVPKPVEAEAPVRGKRPRGKVVEE